MRQTTVAGLAAALLLGATACGSDPTTPGATPTAGVQTSAPGGATLSVTGLPNLTFDPVTLAATQGQAYTIELHQKGSIPHSFTITDFGVDIITGKDGETKTATFTPNKAGAIKYTCKFHPDMTGTLNVA